MSKLMFFWVARDSSKKAILSTAFEEYESFEDSRLKMKSDLISYVYGFTPKPEEVQKFFHLLEKMGWRLDYYKGTSL